MNASEFLKAAESLPFSALENVLGNGGLVVVAPHPDDESLACGGLIAEASAQGRATRVIVVSDGTGSHPHSRDYPRDRLRLLREDETRQAAWELGLDPDRDVYFLRLPDRHVPSEGPVAERAIKGLADRAREADAAALFVSWRHDPHCDHQASYRLARGVQERLPLLDLYEYTIWGAALPADTPVEPAAGGFRLAIEPWLARKRRAIAAHRSQTTDLIDDDPEGFRLTASDLARFDAPYEFFFECER
jgi:LmbE family N-acetylglucosaminyl deacetylase